MNILKYLLRFYNSIFYFFHKDEAIFVNSCVISFGSKLISHNLGDDLNFYLLKELYGKKIIVNERQTFFVKKTNYLVIGSIIEAYSDEKSIIWGSGAMHGNLPLLHKPQAVLAVRGPLTRDYLLSQGIDCPPVYGDPALLLPELYSPMVEKKFKIGIIPHITDFDLPIVSDLKNKGYKIINLRKYNQWRDVVDEILSCDIILSSSLHGLIISDAYCVPNVWIQFKKLNNGNDFKFRDYFASVCREYSVVNVTNEENLRSAINNSKYWKPINIDLSDLKRCCPF